MLVPERAQALGLEQAQVLAQVRVLAPGQERVPERVPGQVLVQEQEATYCAHDGSWRAPHRGLAKPQRRLNPRPHA